MRQEMSLSPWDNRKVFDEFKKMNEERQQIKDASGKKVEQKPNGGVTGAVIIGRNAPLSILNQKGTPGMQLPAKEHLSPTLTLPLHLVDAEI